MFVMDQMKEDQRDTSQDLARGNQTTDINDREGQDDSDDDDDDNTFNLQRVPITRKKPN